MSAVCSMAGAVSASVGGRLLRGGRRRAARSPLTCRCRAVGGGTAAGEEDGVAGKKGHRLTKLSELRGVYPEVAQRFDQAREESGEAEDEDEGPQLLWDDFGADDDFDDNGDDVDVGDIQVVGLGVLAEEGEEDVFGDAGEGGTVEEDVEIFSLDGGWSVDAFDAADLGLRGGGEDAGAYDDPLDSASAALLATLPGHVARELAAFQVEADAAAEALRKRRAGGGTKPKTQRRLRIIAGTASGIRIRSQVGDLTRPMMEKVRGAVFNALISRLGGHGLPEGTRWLDLFAGTGSVGLEGLSRGAADAHFIELDPWVVDNVLEPNLELTRLAPRASVHQMRAEDFLSKAAATPRFAGGAFDFVSVCPPYLLVSYPELFALLDASPLLHAGSHIIVEYPKELAHQIPDAVAGLPKFRDRRYGRTFMAMYGPE
mmetsp:Transcript_9275/g.23445  ORF Transcript_9275/g.23445 Transcript_9275/m.23445 type:complete len:429 (+) Transcript_9275:100-1386(+)